MATWSLEFKIDLKVRRGLVFSALLSPSLSDLSYLLSSVISFCEYFRGLTSLILASSISVKYTSTGLIASANS